MTNMLFMVGICSIFFTLITRIRFTMGGNGLAYVFGSLARARPPLNPIRESKGVVTVWIEG